MTARLILWVFPTSHSFTLAEPPTEQGELTPVQWAWLLETEDGQAVEGSGGYSTHESAYSAGCLASDGMGRAIANLVSEEQPT